MDKKFLKIEYILILIYSLVTKFFVSINSIRFNEVFTESDQSIFFSIGKAMLNGKVLYKDVFDHKTPYIYFFNALAAIFEKNHLGLFIIEVCLLSIILIFLYKTARIFVSDVRAFFATLFLSIILCIPEITFGYSRTEMYAIAFIMPSIYLFAKYFLLDSDDKNYADKMFIIAVLACLTLMTNIRAVVIFIPFALLTCVKLINEKRYINILILFLVGILGVVITLIPYIVYAIFTDSISDAIYAIITTNINYAKSNSAVDKNLLYVSGLFISQNKMFFTFLFLSFVSWFFIKVDLELKISIIASFVITFIYVVFSYKTNVYYLVILMPYLLSLYFLLSRFIDKILKETTLPVLILSSVICLLINMYINRSIDIRYTNCVNRAARINKAIENNFSNRENIKVLSYGFNPEVYVYTKDVLNYKYFIIPNVSYKADPTAYEAQYNYIMSADPDVVVYANSATGNNMPKMMFDRLRYTLSTSYKLVDEFKTNNFTGTFYIFIKP